MDKTFKKLNKMNGISEQKYRMRIIELIRLKYSSDDEFAILRQRDDKPEEFAIYNRYVEDCKAKAKAELEETEEKE